MRDLSFISRLLLLRGSAGALGVCPPWAEGYGSLRTFLHLHLLIVHKALGVADEARQCPSGVFPIVEMLSQVPTASCVLRLSAPPPGQAHHGGQERWGPDQSVIPLLPLAGTQSEGS